MVAATVYDDGFQIRGINTTAALHLVIITHFQQTRWPSTSAQVCCTNATRNYYGYETDDTPDTHSHDEIITAIIISAKRQ